MGVGSLFARFRRKRGADQDQAQEAIPDAPGGTRAPGTAVVELLTADAAMVFEIDPTGERITDLLNTRDTLEVAHGEGRRETVDVYEVLLAFPPSQETHPQRRLHRPRQPLRIRIGPYQVDGHLHVPPGAQATGYLMRVRPRFAALTEAVIRVEEPEPIERRASVVIVNVALADAIEEISDEDAETPQPPATPDAPAEGGQV